MDKDLRWRSVNTNAPIEIYISHLSDDSLTRYHENIRQQIDAERDLKHKLLNGSAVRDYVDTLERELASRNVSVSKIVFSAG